MRNAQEKEVDRNFKAFQKIDTSRLQGSYLLMKNRKVISDMDTFQDALTLGKLLFQDQPFSVQAR